MCTRGAYARQPMCTREVYAGRPVCTRGAVDVHTRGIRGAAPQQMCTRGAHTQGSQCAPM
eukprot:9077536-Pyramimonas_sp.AAC.2